MTDPAAPTATAAPSSSGPAGAPLEVLQRVFGYDAFRGDQAAIIDQVVGGGDALVLMPTGGGKSLCYQVPAIVRPGTGVVVSPLIALMQDQVDALEAVGVRASFLNSTQDPDQRRAVEQAFVSGELDMLYLAPEQIRGEPADPRSDLYSLGIVTYELLTGKLPFTGETAMSIAYKHLSGRVPRPSAVVPTIPADLDGFVVSATDRDRELRPESATVMRHDLEALAPELSAAKRLESIVDTVVGQDRQHRPKYLLACDAHLRGHIGKHRRLHEITPVQIRRPARATCH